MVNNSDHSLRTIFKTVTYFENQLQKPHIFKWCCQNHCPPVYAINVNLLQNVRCRCQKQTKCEPTAFILVYELKSSTSVYGLQKITCKDFSSVQTFNYQIFTRLSPSL